MQHTLANTFILRILIFYHGPPREDSQGCLQLLRGHAAIFGVAIPSPLQHDPFIGQRVSRQPVSVQVQQEGG